MTDSFDICAQDYDTVFTNSNIGKLQRKVVYNFLSKNVLKNKTLNILEINCGTGHDALWLSKNGHNVIASDISSEMIAVANSKKDEFSKNLSFRRIDINAIDTIDFETPFDLIFSNFGGLNCLSPEELNHFFKAAEKKLAPNGKIAAVIMPRHCIVESLYFLAKGSVKSAFRRNTKHYLLANVDGVDVKTWYYSPKDIIIMGKPHFKIINKKAVGLFLPPSYLEPYFKKRLGTLKFLNLLDNIFNKFSILSKLGDHYIISLKKQ